MSSSRPAKKKQPTYDGYELNEAEHRLAHSWLDRQRSRPKAPKLTVERVKGGQQSLQPDHESRQFWCLTVQTAFGTIDADFAELLMSQLVQVAQFAGDDHLNPTNANGVMAAVHGLAPRNEAEAMLAVQMVATHQAAMECYRRAMLKEQTFEGRQVNLNQACKLSRTHATLLETLNKHRGKGRQTVTVEHVHVNEGGQAIVGTVKHGGRGSK